MTNKRQQMSRASVARDLQTLQETMFEDWLENSLPEGWHGVASEVEPEKREETLRLDKDMMAWFKRLTPDISDVVNRILRIYWQSVMSGDTRFHWAPEVYGPSHARFLETLVRHNVKQMEEAGATDEELAELRAVLKEMQRVHRKADPILDAMEAGAEKRDQGQGT